MNQFKMPFRNVQKRISVNAKTNKKKQHCKGKILYELNLKWRQNWILLAIRWQSFNRGMSTCCAGKLFVFRFEGLHKVAQVHSCFHNMMCTNCILLVVILYSWDVWLFLLLVLSLCPECLSEDYFLVLTLFLGVQIPQLLVPFYQPDQV